MLTSLNIKNFLLVEQAVISLDTGMVVITGETGAGKSLVINALLFALGDKVFKNSVELLRVPDENAMVSVCFDVAKLHDSLRAHLEKIGIFLEDQLIIRRIISPEGKSRSFINDIPVSNKVLTLLQDELVEVCGQNANRMLSDARKQMQILDSYAQHPSLLRDVEKAHGDWVEALRAYEALNKDNAEIEVEKVFLQHATQEISTLALKENEEEELLQKREWAKQRHKTMQAVEAIEALIGQINLDGCAMQLKRELMKLPGEISEALSKPLDGCISEFMEFTARFEEVGGTLVGEGDLQDIEDRLFKIRGVARKYNVMSQQLMQLLHDKKAALLDLDSIEERKCSAESVMLKSNGQYMSAALALSHSRRQAADVLSAEVMRHLSDLKMPTAEVVIEMQSYPEDHRLCTALGIDRVKFMVRTNSGLPMAEIGKATSGGETARIMLAIKLVMAQLKEAKILIFDEVDSGISGAVSTSVGRKIAMLAQYSQVITITHQPQVASFAKQHLLVSKRNSDSGATYATIASLDGHGHEREVARLLSGDEITPESLGAAKSLIDAAA